LPQELQRRKIAGMICEILLAGRRLTDAKRRNGHRAVIQELFFSDRHDPLSALTDRCSRSTIIRGLFLLLACPLFPWRAPHSACANARSIIGGRLRVIATSLPACLLRFARSLSCPSGLLSGNQHNHRLLLLPRSSPR